MNKILFVLSILLIIFNFTLNDSPTFGERKTMGLVKNDEITEASGLVASSKNKGVLWTHNDSGNENKIFALDTNGNHLGEYTLGGAPNRDWEDIAIGPGPDESKTYLYIGDIGDNDAQYTFKYVYRIEEPIVNLNQNSVSETITGSSKISFYYPDGSRDAETLMIDPLSKDLYIISKRDSKIRVYKLPYPQSTVNNIQAEISTELTLSNDPENDKPFNYIVAGDISSSGTEIIIKSYSNIYYWYRDSKISIAEALNATSPQILPFKNSLDELQCEAICWKPYDDNGYYTLSEEKVSYNGNTFDFPASLYYYPRTSLVSSDPKVGVIKDFELFQNYPNPFNPSTTIKFNIARKSSSKNVTIKIYDILGNEVRTLLKENKLPGTYQVDFNASNLASGVYYYSLSINNKVSSKKMVLSK